MTLRKPSTALRSNSDLLPEFKHVLWEALFPHDTTLSSDDEYIVASPEFYNLLKHSYHTAFSPTARLPVTFDIETSPFPSITFKEKTHSITIIDDHLPKLSPKEKRIFSQLYQSQPVVSRTIEDDLVQRMEGKKEKLRKMYSGQPGEEKYLTLYSGSPPAPRKTTKI